MKTLDFTDCFFGVIGGSTKDYGIEIKQVYGTAFPISDRFFITAGHSIMNALENEYIGISYRDTNTSELMAIKIINHEIFDKVDMAVFEIERSPKNIKIFKFDPVPQPMLTDIKTGGYPYALDFVDIRFNVRAFKGYIVNYTDYDNDRNIYELSFHCPRGISGAPIFISDQDHDPVILGYIIGNSITEITVFSEKEFIKESNLERIFEKTETTKYGIAIQLSSIMNITSKILKMTIGEFLNSKNLLVS